MRQVICTGLVALAGLSVGCSKAPPKEPSPAPAAVAVPAAAAPIPLEPALAAAIECSTDCRTLYTAKADETASPALALPKKFSELLSNQAVRKHFDAAVKSLPLELQGPLTERPGSEATGNLSTVIERKGGHAYLYGLVRFNPPGEQRSYADIAVDPATSAVAILMRPTPDLDQYFLVGPDALQAALLLQAAAGDVRLAKQELQRVQNPSAEHDWNAEPFILPLPADRAPEIVERLKYLNSKYDGGRLVGVASPAPWVEAKRLQQEAAWYAADLNFSKCIVSMSPAERMTIIQEAGVSARTKDRNDASGRLVEVEVSYSEGARERYYRYFKSKSECEASLARNETVPDRYR